MLKLLLWFKKHYYLGYIITACLSCVFARDILHFNETISIIISYISPFIVYVFFDLIIQNELFKKFIFECDIEKYNTRISVYKQIYKLDKPNNKNRINIIIYNYMKTNYEFYKTGPSDELIKKMNSNLKECSKGYQVEYLVNLFLIHLEKNDKQSTKEVLDIMLKTLKETKFIKPSLYEQFKNRYDTLFKLIFENDSSCKDILYNDISKNKQKLSVTNDYYFLAQYYHQNDDTENERRCLAKVAELGCNTYMANNARRRLKEKTERSD